MLSSAAGRVVLVGEVLADVFPDRTVLGGAPFNVAWHLQAFGVASTLLTRTGQDALQVQLRQRMQAHGMDSSQVQSDAERPSGRVMVHLAEGQHRFEILPEQAYDYLQPASPALPDHAVCYFGTLAQRSPVSRSTLQALLAQDAALRFLDLNLRQPWYDHAIIHSSLQQADILKLNQEELATIASMLQLHGDDAQQHAHALCQQYQLQRVVVTCGAAGAWQVAADGQMLHTPSKIGMGSSDTHQAALQDTVGAGDAYAAVYILGLLHGWAPLLAMTRAAEFAAAVCYICGAIPDARNFYQPFRLAWQLD